MKKITKIKTAIILIANCFLPTLGYTQDGSLDNTFGTGGKVTTPIGVSTAASYSAAIQTDGKIVVAGSSDNTTNVDFALARYSSNGSLDNTFGTGGKVTTAIGSSNDYGKSVAIQTDGKIVVAGYTYNGSRDYFALVRYNTNGSLDNTFGTSGKVTTTVGNFDDYGYSVAIQTDGKILLAGYSHNGSNFDLALVRYASNGSLDNTFGSNGKVTTAIGTSDDRGYSVAIQTDGKIVVAGYSNSSIYNFALVRYTSNGILDNTFGTNGKVTTTVGSSSAKGYSVAIQTDGKIVVAGYIDNGGPNYNFALVRYNNNGSLDNTFGSNGKVTTAIGSYSAVGYSVAFQTDGKIVVAGYSANSTTDYDFALVRYTSNGNLDNTFGTNGKVTTSIGSSQDGGYSVTIQTDGKIVVAGYSDSGSAEYFALVRYNNTITGIVELDKGRFAVEIYPNPFTSQTTVNFTQEQKNTTIKIMDVLGKQLETINFSGKQLIIEKGVMQKGIYFLQVIGENKYVVNNKIIVQIE